MGKGRKPKNDRTKIIKGTFRPCRANKNAPDEDKNGMVAPSWLPADCLDHFQRVKKLVGVFNLDSASWTEAAAMIAMRIHEIETCNRVIEQEGRTYETISTSGDKLFKGHPIVSQKNEAMRHLQSLLSEFGLTPAAIRRVGGGDGKTKKKDPWAEF
jgi:P27 family predicted phage terminase small subunit